MLDLLIAVFHEADLNAMWLISDVNCIKVYLNYNSDIVNSFILESK